MSRLMNVISIVVLTTIWKVNCQDKSPTGSTRNTYDVGCYTRYLKLVEGDVVRSVLDGMTMPRCVEGGMFEVVQCRFFECYCVYVDTGKRFGNWSLTDYTYEQLMNICPVRTEKKVPTCEKPPVTYPCNLSQIKYAYNSAEQRCGVARFGCFGFKTKQQCMDACDHIPELAEPTRPILNKCTYSINFGRSCSRRKEATRYFHNPRTGRCQSFIYKGCLGNENNHNTKWECQRTCVPQGNASIYVRVDRLRFFQVLVPDWLVTRFNFIETHLNEISRKTFAVVIKSAFRVAPIRRLPSSATKPPRIVSTTVTMETNEDREDNVSSRDNICRMPPEIGHCRGLFPRWHYVQRESGCRRFTYGGCFGNRNNFKTLKECMSFCSPGLAIQDISISVSQQH